jgi:hypothetical protein
MIMVIFCGMSSARYPKNAFWVSWDAWNIWFHGRCVIMVINDEVRHYLPLCHHQGFMRQIIFNQRIGLFPNSATQDWLLHHVLHHIVLTYDGTRAGQYVLVKFRACIIYCQAKFLNVHVPYFRVKQPPALVCNRKLSPRVFLCQYGTYDLFLSCHVQSECFSGSWCSQHRQLAQVIFYSSERFPLCVPPI